MKFKTVSDSIGKMEISKSRLEYDLWTKWMNMKRIIKSIYE